jgi:predicted transcriptional regulator
MGQILVQLSDETLAELDEVAPAASRKRSRFIRLAVEKALMEVRDRCTQEAYRRMPDDDLEWFDPRVWDEWRPRAARRRRTKRTPPKSKA